MEDKHSDNGFASLEIEDWRQFDHVNISFHPRLTVLTGANASGKSTLLGVLARHFNWARNYSSSPTKRAGLKGLWSNGGRRTTSANLAGLNHVGSLEYRNGVSTEIASPPLESAARQQYDILLTQQQQVVGLYLTSHRLVSGNYNSVASIPTIFGSSDQIFEQFTSELRARWMGGWSGRTPGFALKEALIAAAVFGQPGNPHVDTNPEALAVWTGFQKVLAAILDRKSVV